MMCCETEHLITKDQLERPVDHSELDSSLWNDKCDYIKLDHCNNLNPNNYNLIIMQINICSILAHQQELSQLLSTLENKDTRIDIILLCETFLTRKTEKLVHIPGYNLIGNHQSMRKGGGVCMLLNENIPYKRRSDLDIFEECKIESVFIEITAKNGRKLIIGSMYKPPNTDSAHLIKSIENIVTKTRCNKNKKQPKLINGMDHNLDLLKGQTHQPTRQFINKTNDLNLLPLKVDA